jgi:transposase
MKLSENNLHGRMRPLLFFDNATIHKTDRVKETLSKNNLRAFTNCPYAPELNAAEHFIN